MSEDRLKQYETAFLTRLLEQMMRIRRFEERSAQAYGLRKIQGFCHLYIGQEAVAVGALACLDLRRDYVLTAYRDHGHALAVGMDPKVVMAELFGKISGCCRGKGGSMHLFDAGRHFFGGNGIVGAHLPVAAGVALKIRYLAEDGVVLCFFGDGAIHTGTFHESLNLARVWELPVIYICENNQYGMGTSFRRVSAMQDFSRLADSYNLPGRQVDGMDVLEVYEQVNIAVRQARQEKIPTLLEARTYRYLGHSMSDPATYRTKEEVESFRKQDPILILQDRMTRAGLLSPEQAKQMDDAGKKAAEEAIRFAEQS
ncbi:MAG: pyruvate dehydrogenase (acetyl-transferring) E1 component subunit alpha, partial [Sedimentisphaerales bacterium]|nr:pyruvate dehydrogenase (acetyl-transferring) E1 component subunit alpha [Sedimentisphaerales bacterium]